MFRKWGSRFLLVIASVGLSLLLLEITIRLFGLTSIQRAAVEFDSVHQAAPRPGRPVTHLVLHPYLGYALRPSVGTPDRLELENYRSLRDDDFVIGIFGGSVARQLCILGSDAIVAELEQRRPELRGSIKVLEFGLGGYKQPQQLVSLSLLSVLGVPLDAVVNLDGYNEVAFGDQNARAGVHPIFPYYSTTAKLFSASSNEGSVAEFQLVATALGSRQRRDAIRGMVDRNRWLLYFESAKAILGAEIIRARNRSVAAEEKLTELSRETHASAQFDLPESCMMEAPPCQKLIVDIWSRSSREMALLASARGALYVHALQPNQYVENSKTLSEEERRTAYDPEQATAQAARRDYVRLRSEGQRLRDDGIDFHDLTMIFGQTQDTIYRDNCCHYNRRGYEIVGTKVAELLDEALDRNGGKGESLQPRGQQPDDF
jgi:hypothetical protein